MSEAQSTSGSTNNIKAPEAFEDSPPTLEQVLNRTFKWFTLEQWNFFAPFLESQGFRPTTQLEEAQDAVWMRGYDDPEGEHADKVLLNKPIDYTWAGASQVRNGRSLDDDAKPREQRQFLVFKFSDPVARQEVPILTFLSGKSNPANKTIPLHHILHLSPTVAFLVFEEWADWNACPLYTTLEIEWFLFELLTGLVYLHSNHIAHLNISYPVIFSGPLQYTRAYFKELQLHPEAPWPPFLPRWAFSDFGFAVRGRTFIDDVDAAPEREIQAAAPEMRPNWDTVPPLEPYNPYKADVWQLGRAFRMALKAWCGVPYDTPPAVSHLDTLIDKMVDEDPVMRPTAPAALQLFLEIKQTKFEDVPELRGRL